VPHFLLSSSEELHTYCPLNHYCNDTAQCRTLTESPFYMAPCAYDSLVDGSDSPCGIGLRCLTRLCRMCTDGEIQDGALCLNGQWTRNSFIKDWIMSGMGPTTLIVIVFFSVSVIVTCCLKSCLSMALFLRQRQLKSAALHKIVRSRARYDVDRLSDSGMSDSMDDVTDSDLSR